MIKKLRTLTPDMATVTVVNDGRRIARNVDPSRTCSMTAICVCVCVCVCVGWVGPWAFLQCILYSKLFSYSGNFRIFRIVEHHANIFNWTKISRYRVLVQVSSYSLGEFPQYHQFLVLCVFVQSSSGHRCSCSRWHHDWPDKWSLVNTWHSQHATLVNKLQ